MTSYPLEAYLHYADSVGDNGGTIAVSRPRTRSSGSPAGVCVCVCVHSCPSVRLCVRLASACVLQISKAIIDTLGIGSSTVGATLIALGSEVPDIVSSVALARRGLFDAALAGAIGSQVISIPLSFYSILQLISAHFCSILLHSDLHSTPICSSIFLSFYSILQLLSAPFFFILLHSTPSYSILLHSAPFYFILLLSALFSSILQLLSTPY